MNLFRTPMMESSPEQEAIECLIILLYCLFVWAVSEVVYYIEKRRNKKK